METRWLIELAHISPPVYYAGYMPVEREINDVSALHQFTDDVRLSKKYPSKKLADDIVAKLPMKVLCVVREHGFGE